MSDKIEPGDLIQVGVAFLHGAAVYSEDEPKHIVTDVQVDGSVISYCVEGCLDFGIDKIKGHWIQNVFAKGARKVGTTTIEELLTHDSEEVRQVGLAKLKANHEA